MYENSSFKQVLIWWTWTCPTCVNWLYVEQCNLHSDCVSGYTLISESKAVQDQTHKSNLLTAAKSWTGLNGDEAQSAAEWEQTDSS